MKKWYNLGKRFNRGMGNRVAHTSEEGVHSISRGLMWVTSGVAVLLVLLIVSHVAGRYLFRTPIPGAVELIELAMVLVVFPAMAYVTFRQGHIDIALLTSRLPRRAQGILASIMTLVGVVVFALLSWQLWLAAWNMVGQYTQSLKVPVYPFKLVASIVAGIICLELLISFLHSLGKQR